MESVRFLNILLLERTVSRINHFIFTLQNVPTFSDRVGVGPISGHRDAARVQLGTSDADLRDRAQRLARSHQSGQNKLTRLIQKLILFSLIKSTRLVVLLKSFARSHQSG